MTPLAGAIGYLRGRRARLRAERDHFALDRAARHMIGDYTQAAKTGASRDVLAEILTGIAGYELAMSRTNPAMGWGTDPDEDGWTVGQSSQLAGLVVQELSYCAREGAGYRGVRAFMFQTDTIAGAFRDVALAYGAWAPSQYGNLAPRSESPVSAGERLSDLWHAVVGVIGGQAAEVLVPLMISHGSNPWACKCDAHKPAAANAQGDTE